MKPTVRALILALASATAAAVVAVWIAGVRAMSHHYDPDRLAEEKQ